jgi:DNA-binding transcriptional regulator GbsR (MarR family)
MELTDVARKFILHWGEMGSAWGVNRSVAQIHALLFFHGKPLHAEELAETLGIARSNVSTSLKELQNWNLIRTTHVLGDRRDWFETSLDVWTLFRTVVRERKEREFDPTTRALREMTALPGFEQEPADVQDRVRDALRLMQTLGSWSDEMLRLSPTTLEKVLKMGASVQRFVRGAPADAAPGVPPEADGAALPLGPPPF